MKKFEYLVVGGGVAGFTAVETLRQHEPTAPIAIINKEPYSLYSRVMLSKPEFFLGKIPFDKIWLRENDWYKNHNVAFIGGKTATDLDPKNKIVSLSDGSQIQYEKLLIATGVEPRPWNVTGSGKKGIYCLRTLEEGKAIMEGIKSAKRAATVGGGFISFEMADLMKLAKLDTTVIIRESYFWEPMLDEDSGKMIEKALEANGIKIIKNAEVLEINGASNKAEEVVLKNGERLPCDMIICGIGVVSPLDWLKSSKIEINKGILADEYLRTSLPDIWVAGDIAEYRDLLLEETVQMGNWVSAREQGRIAGLNMAGLKQPFKFVSFYTTQGMGISVAFIGDVRPLPDRIIIKRGSPEINSYARLLIVGKELVGATLINRTGDLGAIARLIENNVDVSQKHKELADPDFDLKSLIVKDLKEIILPS